MYFILSKVLLFLLYPGLWVFALFVIALIVKDKKRKQRFLILAVILFYIFSIPLLLNRLANAWSVAPLAAKDIKKYSCAIVLGGFSSADEDGNGYFNGSADRFIQGIKLLNTGKVTHILVTGGNGSLFPGKFREGDWVKTQLEEFKVPDSCILIESKSKNTIENAIFTKETLKKAHLQPPYLLVTSDFHMRRALMIFKKEGYDVVAYPCNFTGGGTGIGISDFIPDGGSLGGWNIYLKELVGYVVDRYK